MDTTKVVRKFGIQGSIAKTQKRIALGISKEASRLLNKKAQEVMYYFYNDYTPKYYDRTYDLRDRSYYPFRRYNGRTYLGGVCISAEKMKPYRSGGVYNKKETAPEIVMELGWHGYHGDPTGYNGKFEPIVTFPSPLQMMEQYFYGSQFANELTTYANKLVKK